MAQTTYAFRRDYACDKPVYMQLNEFLSKHPNYTVDKVNYSRPNPQLICEDLFVVFNINEN